MTQVHLICLREPDPEILQAIHTLWPGQDFYEVNETQLLIAKPSNGGKSVYDQIKDKVNKEFAALIIRFQHGYHGRHNPALWEWLQVHVGG